MHIKVKITNFGKLDKAELEFKELTFFAGTNNLGKSYVSRVLYAMFSAIAVNPQRYYYGKVIRGISQDLHRCSLHYLNNRRALDNMERFFSIQNKIERLTRINLTEKANGALPAAEDSLSHLLWDAAKYDAAAINDQAAARLTTLTEKIKDILTAELPPQNKQDNKLADEYYAKLTALTNELKQQLSKKEEELTAAAYAEIVRDKLIKNFQAEEVADLIGANKEQDATVSITSTEEGGDTMKLVISPSGKIKQVEVNVINPEVYSKAVYLESPLYWKLKDKLSMGLPSPAYGDEYLTGVPQYFLEIVERIRLRKITKDNGDAEFREELLAKLERIIGGKIIRDPYSEELLFAELASRDGGKRYKKGISLLLTATGIVQYAMLAYLIERKIIERGTTLFLDEPEVHLHPEWQKSITETLYQLSKHGVNVVIATHSPIIMQKLELCLEEDEEVKDDSKPGQVALNYFSPDGKFAGKTYNSIREEILDSLEGPVYEMYLKQM